MTTHGVQFGTAGAQVAYAAARNAPQVSPQAPAAADPRADVAEFSEEAVQAALKEAGNERHAAMALLANIFRQAATTNPGGGEAGTAHPGSVLARFAPTPDMTKLYLAA